VLGGQTPVKIGTVFKTGAGALEATHGVDKILHVATVKGACLSNKILMAQAEQNH
jgi:hypothetical protein